MTETKQEITPSLAPSLTTSLTPEIEIEEKGIKALEFHNSTHAPIMISFSYNIDSERKTGNVFPATRGQGRQRSPKFVIGAKQTKSIEFPLRVPEDLPIRVTWFDQNNDKTITEISQDIVVTPGKTSSASSIYNALDEDGKLLVTFLYDTRGPYISV